MTAIKFVCGDSVIKPITFFSKGFPIFLREGESGVLKVYDDNNAVMIEKRFTSENQGRSGKIYIRFDETDTKWLEPKINMQTIRYTYDIKITGAMGNVITPLRNGDFILLANRISPLAIYQPDGSGW